MAYEDTHVDDRTTFGTQAHEVAPDEDPEDYMGDVIMDPWCDDQQTDWVTGELNLGDADPAAGASKTEVGRWPGF